MICIGDIRRVMQVEQVRRSYRAGIIDEWEFKALYNYVEDDFHVVFGEGTNWDLTGLTSTDHTKLQIYLWNNIGNSDVWG